DPIRRTLRAPQRERRPPPRTECLEPRERFGSAGGTPCLPRLGIGARGAPARPATEQARPFSLRRTRFGKGYPHRKLERPLSVPRVRVPRVLAEAAEIVFRAWLGGVCSGSGRFRRRLFGEQAGRVGEDESALFGVDLGDVAHAN